VFKVSAPVRICDNGGWTDTWFGGPGRVLNVAVAPGVEVSVCPSPGRSRVLLNVADYGDRYAVVPGEPRVIRHPLLEAALDAWPPPVDVAVEIIIRSAVPPGCGTGTSAAVTVALLGALAALRGEEPSPRQVAYAAHRLEVDVLGGESGIQDQLSAAFGGINYLEIEPYPEARITTLPLWTALGDRLTLVFLGRAHDSSGVHRVVIEGAGFQRSMALSRLREAAVAARDAVIAQDLDAFGQAMIDNTEAQMSLHRDLVGSDAREMIASAEKQGALGWKVNGAGGEGGSITILSANQDDKAAFEGRISATFTGYRLLPIHISAAGLAVTQITSRARGQ
jgi:D-glycero-alpha-D-manno-heptose-7-phosphate kinase